MEIDIQKMVKDYNNILTRDAEHHYKNIEKFKEHYGALEDYCRFEENGMQTKVLSIPQGDKKIILPHFLDTNFTNIPEFSEQNELLETMFESGYKKGDGLKEIELNSPAIFTYNKDGNVVNIDKGKLTLHDTGEYYFQVGNAPTPPSGTPSAKPEPSTETPAAKPEPTSETPVNTKSRQYDFDSAKEKLDNIQAAITNSPSEETKGLVGNVYDARERITELKDGTFKRSYDEAVLNLNSKLNKVNSQMTDLIADKDVSLDKKLVKELKKNFIDTQDMDEVVTESKFNLYRENFKKIKKGITAYEGSIKSAKDSFKENNIDVESKEIKEYFGKIEEAKKEYSRIMKEQNKDKLISGEKPQKTKFLNEEERNKYIAEKVSERNNYIAEKVFGGTEYNNTTKMGLIEYNEANRKLENLKKIKENLGSKIEGMMDKEGNFSYKKAVESSKMGWKGKAAIFGGVALGALSLVGVASMVMSGGRQQNSNLYNPYQAMY